MINLTRQEKQTPSGFIWQAAERAGAWRRRGKRRRLCCRVGSGRAREVTAQARQPVAILGQAVRRRMQS